MQTAYSHTYVREHWVQHESPAVYRYIDWNTTVPLHTIEFNLILKAAGRPVVSMMFRRLLGSTVAMLGFRYAGEATDITAKLGFAIGPVGWAVYHVGRYVDTLTSAADPTLLNAIYNLANYWKEIGFVR